MLLPTMKRFNPHKLLKRDLVWLMTNRCRHHITYIEHPSCYFKEQPDTGPVIEKVGFLDIESSAFAADMGFCISYCIKELDGPIYKRAVTPGEIRSGYTDRNLMRELCKDIRKFDRLIVYWGKDRRFDVPFLRTRALKWGIDFPLYKEAIVNDLYDICKAKLKLQRYGMQHVCKFFGITAKEHRFDPNIWQLAITGNQEAIDHIFEHNIEDVITTEELWKMMSKFSRSPNTTI